MGNSYPRRSIVNFIVLLAMWFNVFAPALSYALPSPAENENFYTVICTTNGTKLVKFSTTSSETDESQQLKHDTNCLVCATLHHALSTPPSNEFSLDFSQNTGSITLQWTDIQTAEGLKWSPSAARAPPSLL